MPKVKRSQFRTFINVGTALVPDYVLLGEGVTTGEIAYNPQTKEETYIHQDSGVTEVESYRPTMAIEASCIAGDDVFDYIDGLRKARAVLDAAKTDIVNVWLYETPVGGEYPAEKQQVSIQIDSFGGGGGETNQIKFTINYLGDPITGMFDPLDNTFTPGGSSS